ncbi:RNaseH domain-containing protein [Streptomyces sp. YGL11-2]|uniref:RNaseH domain-containing protein n=1 Tax=Streptomyces sp. YGL11-2 TaxID=3414028 RepID=UPI003CF79724
MAPRTTSRDLTAHTLAFHCTEQILDGMHAHVWEFSDDTQEAWRTLGETVKKTKKSMKEVGKEEDYFLIPYSIVTTVLKQLTGGYVYLDRKLRYMVTLEPVDADDLQTIFTYLEGICRDVPLADIPFAVSSDVAAKVVATQPQRLPLKEHLPLQEGKEVPDPPGWAYEAIRWLLAIKLATQNFLDYPVEPVKDIRRHKDGSPKLNDKGETQEYTKSWKTGDTPAAVRYRPTSTGELIAWNNPIGPAFAGHGHPIKPDTIANIGDHWPADPTPQDVEYALSYLSTKMVTYPAFTNPVFLFDAHMRRINNALIYSKTVMVDQTDNKPVLTVPLDGRGLRRTNRHAMEILAALEADRSALRAIEERADSEKKTLEDAKARGRKASFTLPAPGRVRPILPKKRSFAVGDGAGPHHLRMLLDHVKSVFNGVAEQVILKSDGNIFSERTFEQLDEAAKEAKKAKKEEHQGTMPFVDIFGLPSPESVRASLTAAGYKGVRFVCLWYRQQTRIRMLNGLAHMYGLNPHTLDPKPKKPIALGEGIDVVFHKADAFLQHGTDINRIRELEKIRNEVAQEGWLLAAWCETQMPEAENDGNTTKKATEITRELATGDAKFQTRRALSATGSPSQYLVGAKRAYKKKDQRTEGELPYEIKPISAPGTPWKDHPVFMGLLDLHRSIGVVDHRFEEALYDPDDPYRIPRMAFCGIHIRKQQADRRFRGQPKRIITASCLIPSRTPGGTWRHIAWTNLDPEGRWRDYNEAQSLFHSLNYPLHKEDGADDTARWAQAGRDVRDALQKLPNKLMGLPYTLMVDGHACRRAWPGLHNNKQGTSANTQDDRLWLPTQGLGTHPASIIRMNCFQAEMPRLAYVTRTKKNGEQEMIKTSSDLYHPQGKPEGHPWFLFTEPRNYGKKRYGQHKTRWRAELAKTGANGDYEENEMNSPWYTMTTREITPMYTQGGYDREALAVAAARLSHQALTWCDRTRYPAPLHAALQMDLDHPQYRRSAPQDDPEQQHIIAEASGGKAGAIQEMLPLEFPS